MSCPTTRRRATAAGPTRPVVLALLVAGVVSGCGKKGPPLAPLVVVPARVEEFSASRAGSSARLIFRVPTSNSNATSPANLERMEVYGFTGPSPSNQELVKVATLVATVPVRRPPEPPKEVKRGDKAGKPEKPAAPEVPAELLPPSSMENGFQQGDLVSVSEPLGPEQKKVVEPKRTKRRIQPRPPDPLLPYWPPVEEVGGGRMYVVVGVNRDGRRGPFSPRLSVPFAPAPGPPSEVKVTYAESGITLTWTPPPDARRATQDPPAEGELASTPRGDVSAAGGFNVYEVPAAEAASESSAPASPATPRLGTVRNPLNPAPLPTPSFVDTRMEFGKERCYTVRAVSVFGTLSVEGESSAPACATPADTFPPAAPKGLAAVATEGAISLIWEANAEADLAGYLVLRGVVGQPPGPLTDAPIAATTYRDAAVKAGVRYGYLIIAVDKAGNRSEPSAGVAEIARRP